LNKNQAKARILSQVLDLLNRCHWQDTDDFSLRFVDKVAPAISTGELPYSAVLSATRTKTGFFIVNHISRETFCTAFVKELGPYLREIGVATNLGSILFSDLFPEIRRVDSREAEELLPKLESLDERKIQDALRGALREKGATNMVSRKNDGSQEVADLEHFVLKINGRDTSFACVVKGFKSLPAAQTRFKDIAHQIVKAYNGTFPDYILLVLAKQPVQSVITSLTRYAESVDKKDLVIQVDPIDLTRFLRCYKVI